MRTHFRLGVIMAGLASSAAGPLPGVDPGHRVLLLLAPRPDDPALQRQAGFLRPFQAGLAERDVRVVEHTGPEAAAWARRVAVPAGQFSAVLVGKDGGVKLRRTDPVEYGQLAALIDTMPMRQDEMRRQGK